MEACMARVCREAGGRVRTNVLVRDMSVAAPRPDDSRRLEVVANNLPLYGGAQLAIDTTIVSALRGDGAPRAGASEHPGVAIRHAESKKRRTYPELCGSQARARLTIFAVEVGGRWSEEAWRLVRLLARARARSEPALLKASAEAAWKRRWTAMLAVAAQRAVAQSLLELPPDSGCDSFAMPSTSAVLEDAACRPCG